MKQPYRKHTSSEASAPFTSRTFIRPRLSFWKYGCLILGLLFGVEIYLWINYMQRQQIPKIIHYVWVGDKEKLKTFDPVIQSWKKYAPEYQFMLWDEDRCDIQSNPKIQAFYNQKSYNLVSDYCRFKALEAYGGLYLDTDHFLTQNPDKLLKGRQLVLTYEHDASLSASFIAAIPHHPCIRYLLKKVANPPANYVGPNPLISGYVLKVLRQRRFSGERVETPILTLLPANLAMFDLGGGENVAKHAYAGGNTLRFSVYYDWYRSLFIQSHALFIQGPEDSKNCEPIIPRWDGTYYRLSDHLDLKWLDETDDMYLFQRLRDGQEISLPKCQKRSS